MEGLLNFFQVDLEKNFHFDDDAVIEQLQIALEELRKAKMDIPPDPVQNELPTLPFGLEIQPSIQQIIGRRNSESIDEHFRHNPPSSSRRGYRKKRSQPGTPGTETQSTQSSRNSEFSIDERSLEYDTPAANSRVSLGGQSSRTSFADASDVLSASTTISQQRSPRDETTEKLDQATPSTQEPPRLCGSDSVYNHSVSSPDQPSNASDISDYDNLSESFGRSLQQTEKVFVSEAMPTSQSDFVISYQRNDSKTGQDYVVKTSRSMTIQDGVTHTMQGRGRVANVRAELSGHHNGFSADQYNPRDNKTFYKKRTNIPKTAFL